MAELAKEVLQVNLEDEMRQSYLDYAMSVIVGRALPDVRDGLKPVHRRVLFAMNVLGNDWNKAYKKSARVVGDVIGKYHPHGDTAVYDTIVRMAQPFSMRYMLVDGQGNFGSVDGDAAAAMRYTEVRMSRLAHELLSDLDKETVDFTPNYDESEWEPQVMPTRVPTLLVNGSAGIAVGMATNIPPHNLNEVIDATIALIDDPSLDVDGIMEHLPGPDFPTAGIINGAQGIREAYKHRSWADLHASPFPYRDQRGETASNPLSSPSCPTRLTRPACWKKLPIWSGKRNSRALPNCVMNPTRTECGLFLNYAAVMFPEVVLNNLFKQTVMQSVFGINMVALVDGQPKLLNVLQVLNAFVGHRREVVTRRTLFDLRKARARAHVLEGLTVALANLDEAIELIKKSSTPAEARERLLAQRWEPGLVKAMLGQGGAETSRPEELEPEFGLQDDGYQLSPVQARKY